ncbi:MAG: GTPase HflX [Hydrogenophaga sp.]|uniref:GTPase HflX n=1 Tax=Hydrogenophaga sp. TaxID=1904254 RepID=UPI00271EB1EE|nr:GTPase HflX [Hydrogenophaga sp.]MDO9569906.1 GTPase HflX [Hydrogenophaga sp.]MDP2096697.1 GTPase HflX [Hydrogenophaga sp.]MDP3375963.1 GTPase HflX [Hydrogenophaga sp.]
MTDLNPSEPTSTASPSVILVGVDFGVPHFDGELEELGLLAQTAGYTVADRVSCKRRAPDPALFVGSGKADEIKLLAQSTGASEVLFDQALSPAQQRNLERHLGLPVNDRTLLILEIFAQRARSHEGKLQVELARLQYLSTRLVRRWSHLERQSGGIGMRGGPGEKQIELDRRLISDAIKRTKERLGKVKKQRATQRRQRERRDAFNISLVGYTNAGKSSLFNGLVKARTYAADQLFATLDTTTRQLYLGEAGRSVSLSDTVGFIRDLPHGLVDAFAATLQEAVDADLLLHVVDASNPAHPEQIASVMGVLKDIGADQIPQILVFNKLDAMDPATVPALLVDLMELDGQSVPRIYVSARSGQGFPELRGMLAERVMSQVGEAGDMGPYDQGSFEGIENT